MVTHDQGQAALSPRLLEQGDDLVAGALVELILNREKPPPPPPPPPPPNPPPPFDDEEDGIFPDIRVSVSVSPPAAVET